MRKGGVMHKGGRSLRRSFFKNREGSSAVEFAIVAPVFLALTFSILEAGYFFFVEAGVEAANDKAARLIRTGQAQSGAMSREAFFDQICNVVELYGDCEKQLTVDVARFSSFAQLAADTASPICLNGDASDDDLPPTSYQTGGARDIIRVRVCFTHKSLSPGIGINLEKTGDGAVKMLSTSVFRSEPYEDS
ncbi:MAG: TadE/TadG family type IV pilus assembly protein [Parvularculaceae bacterium]|nr:pilus assembly protein [Parvularculaceae bacterium]